MIFGIAARSIKNIPAGSNEMIYFFINTSNSFIVSIVVVAVLCAIISTGDSLLCAITSNITLDFKKNTNAIIVGEATSGKPNHFGEVKSFILPNSKIKTYYSTKYFKRTENNTKTITPDIKIVNSFTDFKAGKDNILSWILKQ